MPLKSSRPAHAAPLLRRHMPDASYGALLKDAEATRDIDGIFIRRYAKCATC